MKQNEYLLMTIFDTPTLILHNRMCKVKMAREIGKWDKNEEPASFFIKLLFLFNTNK